MSLKSTCRMNQIWWKRQPLFIRVIAIGLLVCFLAVFISILVNFLHQGQGGIHSLALLGDSMAIVGLAVAAAGTYAIVVTLQTQQRQLDQQRKEFTEIARHRNTVETNQLALVEATKELSSAQRSLESVISSAVNVMERQVTESIRPRLAAKLVIGSDTGIDLIISNQGMSDAVEVSLKLSAEIYPGILKEDGTFVRDSERPRPIHEAWVFKNILSSFGANVSHTFFITNGKSLNQLMKMQELQEHSDIVRQIPLDFYVHLSYKMQYDASVPSLEFSEDVRCDLRQFHNTIMQPPPVSKRVEELNETVKKIEKKL